jgi:CRISPR-associated Cas5-like protein
MQALLIRLAGVTAHFRDPRINTAKIGLLARTLHCPPPCTIHGLLMAAKGGWIEPSSLKLGWKVDYASVGSDFQTSQLPQRGNYNWKAGLQHVKTSPVEREYLAFPILSVLALEGVLSDWFRCPANPLSLGRSEDLVTERIIEHIEVNTVEQGYIARQCLPLTLGSGTVYPAPMYFENKRRPVGMAPRVDARQKQEIKGDKAESTLAHIPESGETFYVWNFGAFES